MEVTLDADSQILPVIVWVGLCLLTLAAILVIGWLLCRLFIRGWAALFLATTVLFFAMFMAEMGVLAVVLATSASSQPYSAPWWVWLLASVGPALIGSAPFGVLFLRWQKHQQAAVTTAKF